MGGAGVIDDESATLLPGGRKGPWQVLDGVINHCGFKTVQWQLFVLCALVNFIEAMVTALIPLLFPMLKVEWRVDNAQLALLGSAISIGMLIGAVLLGKSSDIVGRKISMLICLIIIAVFGFASAFAPSMPTMAALQLLLGVGYGGNIVISTTYLCEFMPKNVRGVALTIVAFFFGVGGIVCVALAMYLIPILGWRKMLMLTITPIFPAIILLCTAPESPRYYLHTGQIDNCIEVLLHISKKNGVKLPEDMVPTRENMKLVTKKRVKEVSFSEQLADPQITKTLIPLLLCWFFNAFGANIFSWIPLYIAENKSLTGGGSNKDPMHNAYVAAMMMSVGDMTGTFLVALCFAFDCGRRVLLFLLLLLVGLLVIVIGRVTSIPWLLVLLPLAKSCHSTTVLYTYTPEVFPTSFRVNGLAMCSTVHRFAPIVAPFLAAALMRYSFIHVSMVFGGLFLCGSLSSLFLSVETAGKDVVEDSGKGKNEDDDELLLSQMCRGRVAGVISDPLGRPPPRIKKSEYSKVEQYEDREGDMI